MPVEIRELVIKTSVVDVEQQNQATAEKPGQKQDSLVRESVEQMLEILKRKKER